MRLKPDFQKIVLATVLVFLTLILTIKNSFSENWSCKKKNANKTTCQKIKYINDSQGNLYVENKITYLGKVENSLPSGKGSMDIEWIYWNEEAKKSPWNPYRLKNVEGTFSTDAKNHLTSFIDSIELDHQGNKYFRKNKNIFQYQSYNGRSQVGKFEWIDRYPIPLLISGKINFEKNQIVETFEGELYYKILKNDKFLHSYKNGKMIFRDGKIYKGDFANNFYHGKGELTFPNGDRFEGLFANDDYYSGKYIFKNGSFYEGKFIKGKIDGEGKYVTNKISFVGTFDLGKYKEGILTYSNGEYYEGKFLNNKMNGYGTYFFKDGSKYVGDFKNDKFHGEGSYYKNLNKISGKFIDGKLQKKSSYNKALIKDELIQSILNEHKKKKNNYDHIITKNNGNIFNEFNSINGRYNPDNPFSEVSSPFGKLNPDNPFSEVSSPFGDGGASILDGIILK